MQPHLMHYLMNYKNKIQCKIKTSGSNRHKLTAVDEFLLTLMRIKLGLVIQDLAFRFCISKKEEHVHKWVNIIYVQMSFLIYWPTKEQINATMSSEFKELFPKTCPVIDCSELTTETPRTQQDRSLM